MTLGLHLGLGLSGGGRPGRRPLRSALSIFGDSTAAFTGVSEYGRGWGWMLAKDPDNPWAFNNAAVGGEDTAAMLARVAADTAHRTWPTVFMDLPNTGETAATWIANMKAAAGYLPHNRWMVMPPCQDAPGTTRANVTEVQAALLSDPFFVGHTLDATDQAAYIAALSTSDTRSDGIHFNDLGQAIQCLFVSAFFSQQGWRVEAPETTALVARITTPPTTRRRSLMNGLIERQKRLGAWAKRDAFYVLAAADEQAAKLNWIGSSYNLTNFSATFLADRYFKGNGAGVYLETGFNPTTASSPKFTLNSAHIGVWSRTNLQNGGSAATEIGNGNTRISRGTTSGLGQWRPNFFSTRDIGAAAFPGLVVGSRTAASVWEGYSSGVDSGGGTDTASSLTNATFTICGANDILGFGVNELATAFFGSGLTAAEAAQDYYSQSAYLRAIGAV
jgi:hypothetical protein